MKLDIITKTNKTIEVMCVPTHAGVIGNEKIDFLSNKAIKSPVSTIINFLSSHDILKK